MKALLFILIIFACSSCYHTDKNTLQSLVTVNQSLIAAKNVVEQNIEHNKDLLEIKLKTDRTSTMPAYSNAQQAIRLSDYMVQRLQNLKIKLAAEVGKVTSYTDDTIEYLQNKDAVGICNNILFNGPDAEAKLLKADISKYRKNMIALMNCDSNYHQQRDTQFLKIGLLMHDHISPDGNKLSWEDYNFRNSPLVADITTLTRLQVDIRDCESEFIYYFRLIGSIHEYGVPTHVGICFDKGFPGKMVATPAELDSIDRISYDPPIDGSFEMLFIEKGKQIILSSNTSILTQEMHNEMKKLSKGDRIIIQNVRIIGPDGYYTYKGPTILID